MAICEAAGKVVSFCDFLADVSVEFDTDKKTFQELKMSLIAVKSSTGPDSFNPDSRMDRVEKDWWMDPAAHLCTGDDCDEFNHLVCC